MKTFTFKLCVLIAFVLFAVSLGAQVTYEDDFSTVRDYLTEGVEGTIWDTIIVNDTIEGNGAPVGQLLMMNTDTVPGALTIKSTDTHWGGGWTNGILLAKVIPADHNFSATVQLVGGNLTSWIGPLDYMCPGLLVRNPDVWSGDLVDVWAFDRDNWSAVHLFETWDDEMESETAIADAVSIGDNPWVKLQRDGNNFIGYYGPDGENWTEIDQVERDDLAGIDLQIGIGHSMNTSNIGHAVFDNFKLVDESATSVEDVKLENKIETYYNVANKAIVIKSSDNNLDFVKLISVDGKVIKKVKDIGSRVEIAVSQHGIYIVLIESNGKVFADKVVVH